MNGFIIKVVHILDTSTTSFVLPTIPQKAVETQDEGNEFNNELKRPFEIIDDLLMY